jgi:hypothetical protein
LFAFRPIEPDPIAGDTSDLPPGERVCWTLRGEQSRQGRKEKCDQHAFHRFGSYSTERRMSLGIQDCCGTLGH